MLQTKKISDLCKAVGVTQDWAVRTIEERFQDLLLSNGGELLVPEDRYEEMYNFLTTTALDEAVDDEVGDDEVFLPESEVLLIDDASDKLGVSKQVFLRAIRRAQALGINLPAVTIINNGGRGRPFHGYSHDFIAKIKTVLDTPKVSTLFGANSSYEIPPKTIISTSLISNEFATKKLLGKFDENLQTLLDLLTGAKEYGLHKDDIANKLDISPKTLNGMLTDLQNRGYNLAVTNDSAGLETNFTADYTSRGAVDWGTNGTYKIGLVSDLHACCEYTKIKSIQSAYKQFEKQGVSIVFNAGDTTHGHVDMHGSYKYEIKLRNLENQLDHLVADYPKIDGIQTFMIAGNHDLSWGRQGVDFIKLLSDRREDITYLGPTVAFVDGPDGIANFMMLYHPKDGSGYALSYKTQKIAEYVTYALKGLIDDPDIPNVMPQIATIGHYHKYVHHKGPDGAHYITCPAMCGMTDFQKGKHLINEMGALMFEFGLNDAGKIDFWSIKGFDVDAGKEVLYVEEQYSSPRVSISGFWKKNTDGGKI